MSYELTYEAGEFYVWSTVVDGYIGGPFATPEEVANFITYRPVGRVPETESEARRLYKMWHDEAIKVRRHPEEGLQIAATLDLSSLVEGGEPTIRVFEAPVRMTPKLEKLQIKFRKGRR